jgi:hypothetical protein
VQEENPQDRFILDTEKSAASAQPPSARYGEPLSGASEGEMKKGGQHANGKNRIPSSTL